MQEQVDKHPERTLEEWTRLATEHAQSPDGLDKSPRSTRKSASVGSKVAGITGKRTEEDSDSIEMMQDDSLDDVLNDVLNDVGGVEDEILGEEAINPQGIPLNEHVLPGEEDFNNDGFLNINVNTQMRNSFKAYCEQHDDLLFPVLTDPQARAVRLLEILRRKKTSLDTYDDVMLWHFRENGLLNEDDKLKQAGDKYVSRTKLLEDLAIRYNMASKYPYTKPTKLPHSGQTVDLVCFDAWGCIESLLTDPRLTDDDFWFFDENPFADPPEEWATITDLHSGMAYRDAHKLYKKKPNQIVLPICMYLDGANTGFMKNMPITALKMTLGIFTRQYRDLDQAWRVLGHVHSVSKNQAKAKKAFKLSKHIDAGLDVDEDDLYEHPAKDPSGPSKDLHKMLDVILESYRDVQEKGFMWSLRYRGKTYEVEFIPFVIFMKCDTQEGDQLCGSYTARSGNVSQLCRYCLCSREETDNPQASFGFKTPAMVKPLVDLNDLVGLKEISQQSVDNAFYKIRFSPTNNRGIHGGTPSEMLHAILLGIFPMCRDGVFEQVGDKSKMGEDFEALAMLYGKQFGRQSDRVLPKCTFNSGIREGKLNAKEYRGILLVVATVFRCSSGQKKLIASGKSRQWIQDWLELVEIVLCWEAFLCQSAMTRVHVAKLGMKNRYLMWMLKKVVRRKAGMGMKTTKYHMALHIALDIMLYGVPLEVDTGTNESGHKPVKAAARTTQKNEKTFDIQTATRLHEHLILDLAIEELDGRKLWRYYTKPETKLPEPVEPEDQIVTGGTTINIFDDSNGRPCFSIGVGRQAKTPSSVVWDSDVLNFLHVCQEKLREWTKKATFKLKICTEQTRNGQIFHGHPAYRGDNHWRDWVMIDWGGEKPEPAHIWCFLDLNGIGEQLDEARVYGNCELTSGVFAVVECAMPANVTNNEPKSRLFEPMVKEMRRTGTGGVRSRKFYLVETDAITDPCFMIPDVGSVNGDRYFRVKSRDEWVFCLEDWLSEPYPDEYLKDKEGRAFETPVT